MCKIFSCYWNWMQIFVVLSSPTLVSLIYRSECKSNLVITCDASNLVMPQILWFLVMRVDHCWSTVGIFRDLVTLTLEMDKKHRKNSGQGKMPRNGGFYPTNGMQPMQNGPPQNGANYNMGLYDNWLSQQQMLNPPQMFMPQPMLNPVPEYGRPLSSGSGNSNPMPVGRPSSSGNSNSMPTGRPSSSGNSNSMPIGRPSSSGNSNHMPVGNSNRSAKSMEDVTIVCILMKLSLIFI